MFLNKPSRKCFCEAYKSMAQSVWRYRIRKIVIFAKLHKMVSVYFLTYMRKKINPIRF